MHGRAALPCRNFNTMAGANDSGIYPTVEYGAAHNPPTGREHEVTEAATVLAPAAGDAEESGPELARVSVAERRAFQRTAVGREVGDGNDRGHAPAEPAVRIGTATGSVALYSAAVTETNSATAAATVEPRSSWRTATRRGCTAYGCRWALSATRC